jgi:hypothetical protein
LLEPLEPALKPGDLIVALAALTGFVIVLGMMVIAGALSASAATTTRHHLDAGFTRSTLRAECALRNHYSAGDSDRPGAFDPRCVRPSVR